MSSSTPRDRVVDPPLDDDRGGDLAELDVATEAAVDSAHTPRSERLATQTPSDENSRMDMSDDSDAHMIDARVGSHRPSSVSAGSASPTVPTDDSLPLEGGDAPSRGATPASDLTSALQAYMSPSSPPLTAGSAPPPLSSFQSHALSTVQSMAASFGHIATVLQKDQAHAAREEEHTRRKLAALQSAVTQLTAQNKELAAMVVRASEKSTSQARELNDKINNLNNKMVVGLSAAGVAVNGGGAADLKALQSRRGSMIESLASAAAVPTVQVGAAPDSSTQLLLERLARLEHEVASQSRRADASQANLAAYFTKLQSQLRQNQRATIQLVDHATGASPANTRPGSGLPGAGGGVAKSQEQRAMERVFDAIEAPEFEPVLAGSESNDFAYATNMSGMTPDVREVLADLRSQAADNAARHQALQEVLVPAEKRAALDSRLRAIQAQMAVSKEAALTALDQASAARNGSTSRVVTPADLLSSPLSSFTSPTRARTPGPDLSFTPRSHMEAEQARLDASIQSAAAAAAAQQQRRKDPFLSAEALAATAASHAAQVAAKQAQDALAAVTYMRDNFSSSSSSSPHGGVLADLLHDSSESRSGGVGSALAVKKLAEKMRDQERAVWTLDSTVSSLSNQVADLTRSLHTGKESSSTALKVLGADFGNIVSQFSALSRQFQAQHKVLDGRISNYREEFDLAIKHSIDALQVLERNLDKKADMKLVLDKVSRAEYQTQIKKLKQIDDEILNRSVNRDEYRLHLNEIREVMSEDQRERVANITRIANELSRLVTDVDQKASKSDLVDIAAVLNAMPKVHDEVESLKTYVNKEITTRATEILDVAVDRRQLKRSMQRLLKNLQEEVQSASMPINCDACALRTGVHSGTNCLSCAQQMKLNGRLAAYAGLTSAGTEPHEHEILASRGGGFMVTASAVSPSPPASGYGRRPGSKQASHAQTASQEWRAGAGSAIRPTSSASTTAPTRRNTALPPAHGASAATPAAASSYFIDHFPLPSTAASASQDAPPQPLSARSEVGSDGRVYSSRGSRTHRLVSTSTKSRLRAEEEGADGRVGQWREEKDATDTAKPGSHTARIRK